MDTENSQNSDLEKPGVIAARNIQSAAAENASYLGMAFIAEHEGDNQKDYSLLNGPNDD